MMNKEDRMEWIATARNEELLDMFINNYSKNCFEYSGDDQLYVFTKDALRHEILIRMSN